MIKWIKSWPIWIQVSIPIAVFLTATFAFKLPELLQIIGAWGSIIFWIAIFIGLIFHFLPQTLKERLKVEPSHLILIGLIIASSGIVWQMLSQKPSNTLNLPAQGVNPSSSKSATESTISKKPAQTIPKSEVIQILSKSEYSHNKAQKLRPILDEIDNWLQQTQTDFYQARSSFGSCWRRSRLHLHADRGQRRHEMDTWKEVPISDVIKALEDMSLKLSEVQNKLREIPKKYPRESQDISPFINAGDKGITQIINASNGFVGAIKILPSDATERLVEEILGCSGMNGNSKFEQFSKELNNFEEWVKQCQEAIENKRIEFEKMPE